MIVERAAILKRLKAEKVAYLRLWFTDIMGHNKNVEVPASQFEKALDGQILFDGSSIEGFSRIEESDMLLSPDYKTFCIFPWDECGGKVARLICNVQNPDGTDFVGCPRSVLRRTCKRAAEMGYVMNAGTEAEFFLFEHGVDGEVTTRTNDAGGYFDLTPIDRGEEARRAIVQVLEQIGFEVEAAHHEVAMGQHEIDFKYSDAVTTADNIATFRFVVRKVALDFGLHATFMPKPIYGISGSGMHTHQSLFNMDGENAFYDPEAKFQISAVGLHYIAGLLKHAAAFCAITNPLVNSFKRLVPGFEAPTHVAWSERNRSPLIRVPDRRGISTRAELRSPDPACNPYLALAVMLAAGLDGIERKLAPGAPINKNIYAMSEKERSSLKINSLPANLSEAIALLARDSLMQKTLGDHIFQNYIRAKKEEWNRYIAEVHQWELDWYLTKY
ncbi:MAG: type I glutamate--ammonia ligase [Gammaproteobacteria bacterium]|nr:type I glutamate--ammonia ligase [Gammaproteobacteria bacterium]